MIWHPPILNWVKVKIDGALTKNPAQSSCGGIFRNSDGAYLGGFAQNLNTNSSFNAELLAAIELAYSKGWLNLWLETDSLLAMLAFRNKYLVAWELRNRWCNCIELLSNMNFIVSHIYREGILCANGLANLGLALSSFVWFPSPPPSISADFVRNRLDLPNFRCVVS